MTAFSEEDVISRLHKVIDPCSAATKVPLSIVEMGMVESVEIESGHVTVALRMTSPLCHALPYFEMEIERVLAEAVGIVGVSCTFDHGGNWQPDNMTSGARRKLADQREFVRNRADEKTHTGFRTLKPVEAFNSLKAT
jgi:metal-sulfur cluster biosynthetic enzyme